MPSCNPAAYHSATLTDRNAVKAVGANPDGLLERSMYGMQVKTPAESNGPWDTLIELVKTMSGDEAYGSLANSTCPPVRTSDVRPSAETRFVAAVRRASARTPVFRRALDRGGAISDRAYGAAPPLLPANRSTGRNLGTLPAGVRGRASL